MAYHDTDGPNLNPGWAYRPTPVGVEYCLDESGEFNVGGIRQGNWLAYTVEVKEGGIYDMEARVASIWAGGQFHVECGGRDLTGSIDVPYTEHWQTYTTVARAGIKLPAGKQVIRIVFDRAGGNSVCNLNWIAFKRVER